MQQVLNDIRPYAELFSLISNVGLFLVSLYALKQIRLMKADIMTTSERNSKEKAIEASSEYLCDYTLLQGQFFKEYQGQKLSAYSGSIEDFSPKSIPSQLYDNALKRFALFSWLEAINKLESIAAMFTTGVADEKTGFQIIGRTFCATVGMNYDLISLSRHKSATSYYHNIVTLYQIWSPRLTKSELTTARKQLDEDIAKIEENNIPIIKPKI